MTIIDTTKKLNWFERRMLKRIAKKLVLQDSDHDKCIEGYYRVMNDAARTEFNEDQKITLDASLREWFEKSLEKEVKKKSLR